MTHTLQNCRLFNSAAEEHHKRTPPWQLDYAAVLSCLVGQKDPQHPLSSLSFLRRSKMYSFVFAFTILFLILASYVLNNDSKMFFTAFSYQNIKPGTLSFNSSSKDSMNISQMVHRILNNVEFTPRKLPDLEMLVQSEPHLFSVIPRHFLPDVKNPCWYEHLSGNISINPYQRNLYALYSRQSRVAFDSIKRSFWKHVLRQQGHLYRIRCLPYFYVIGQPKCGTTDLYERIQVHPDIRVSALKEPHWWTRKRFGIIRPNDGLHARYPIEDYLDLFDFSAHQIQDQILANRTGGTSQVDTIIGEASASTMWDNNAWIYFHSSTSEAEPPFLIQDFIHALQPKAQFITILRDPVERLYSDYLYFGIANKSAEDFHEKVWESLQLFDACLQEFSVRACVYNNTLNNAMPVRLHVGLYVVYILDWLSVFSRDQFLVLRLEDHAADKRLSMNRIFHFLHLGPLSEQKEAEIADRPASNTRKLADKNLGPMLPLTHHVLTEFYSPFNRKLANAVSDDSFLWNSYSMYT